MPNNDDLVFDYHEHPGLNDVCTHDHDDHPRHHHDRNGSVIYLDDLSIKRGPDDYIGAVARFFNVDDGGTDAFGNIGVGGYDVTHRTPRQAPPHRPVD